MVAAAPAVELVPLPAAGRRYAGGAEVRLGDTDPAGRLRLDATARMLQDVANDDARDAGLDNANGWVVRRTLIEVRTPATLGERLTLTTFCGGTGRCWAERRTSVAGDRGSTIEAVSLWVQVDTTTGRPAPLGPSFYERYATAAAGRTVSSRLSLPGPPDGAPSSPWTVRAVDLDVFGHVNNAVAWAVLEERLTAADSRTGTGEVEYPGPLDRSPVELVLAADHGAPMGGVDAWLVADGVVRVAARWRPDPPDPVLH